MKYRQKLPKDEDMRVYKEICISCGKEQFKTWPRALPIPNMTSYLEKPSWLKCKLGSHYYYSEDQLELNQ